MTCGTGEKAKRPCSVSTRSTRPRLRDDIPDFRAGDTVKVHVKVVEGTRSRVQVFQGVVIRRHGGGVGETFTVRKVSFGVGVERTFPLHTPIIDKIEVVTRGDVRRAKLYYLRELRGKAAKIKEKRETTPAKLRRVVSPPGAPACRPEAEPAVRLRRVMNPGPESTVSGLRRRACSGETAAAERPRGPSWLVLAGVALLVMMLVRGLRGAVVLRPLRLDGAHDRTR